MNITKSAENDKVTIAITGRLDTNTAPQLEAELKQSIEETKSLVFDFTKLDYVSSAGLRVILAAQKQMNKQGSMVITNVKPTIMEVFEITGFADILTIE